MKTLKKLTARAAIIGMMAFSFLTTESFASTVTYSQVMNYLRAQGYVVYSLKSCGDGKWIADTQHSYDIMVITNSSQISGTQQMPIFIPIDGI